MMKKYLGNRRKKASSSNLEDDILREMLLDVDEDEGPVVQVVSKRPRLESPEPEMATQEFLVEDKKDIEIIPNPITDNNIKANIEYQEQIENKEHTLVYWYDCCEDQIKSPGNVYFFGRLFSDTTKRYGSCCVIVRNVPRTCYLLINQDSTYEQAEAEFSKITAVKFRIKNFTCEKVTKKYSFSSDSSVPLVADYVKVDYPASQTILPGDLKGETFSRVLNVNQTPMEKIILDLKLRGPCWLKLINPTLVNTPITWAKTEFELESPSHLMAEDDADKLKPPYFCALSLSIRTYPNPVTHHNEIIAIAGMVNTAFNLDECLNRNNKASGHFLIMTKPPPGHKEIRLPYDFQAKIKKYNKTRFELAESERDLLSSFMDKFMNYDPDIVVGHDLLNFDLETLVMRMNVTKLGLWSKLGRFRRSELPRTKAAFRYMFAGRSMCDIRTSAMELIRSRSYDLTELMSQVLKKDRVEYNHAAIVDAFKTSDGVINLLNATWDDNDSIFSIMAELNVIPLALKITNITGNILSRTLAAGRSERNEYLLLHAFHEENFICPEKQASKFNKKGNIKGDQNNQVEEFNPTRKKAAYAGGLVLDPKTGFYDSCVLLMDFNSLYPSIIQEFNICFSTVKLPEALGPADNAEIIAKVPDESAHNGILPTQLKNLVDRRRQVKRLLADCKVPAQKLLLDIEQKALKLTANSMYGCLGFEQSRFYAKHLASLVTFKGREILMTTKAMVERLGYEVIYGDTDSLMIDTKITEYDEVIKRGIAIKGEINKTFKLLEIDIDGVYRPLLLLKKKNYAGASVKKSPDGQLVKSIETKGLDTVRRDRAVIAKEAGERVLSMILENEKDICQTVEDIHNYLKQLGEDINAGQVPPEKFLISKQLNRNPEDYRELKGIGHVALALRYNNDSRKTRKLKSGDTVDYVICLDNTTESANQRAYSLEELATNPDLKLDYEYYLCQQIHPVMTRICDKLPVTNAYVLAEMLGIESSNLLHIKRDDNESTKKDQLASKGNARFNSCKPLTIHCPNCNLPDDITTRTRKYPKDKKLEFSLNRCQHCGVRYAVNCKQVVVQIILLIKQLTLAVYNARYVCDSSDCTWVTRNVFGPLTCDDFSSESSASQALPTCEQCGGTMKPEMNDRDMDLQLGFIKHLFDVQHERDVLASTSDDVIEMYASCFKEADEALRMSFNNNVDAYSIFSMVCSGRNGLNGCK